ncbi:MAG: HDOD domain-containing protein [Rhodothermales bacterium]
MPKTVAEVSNIWAEAEESPNTRKLAGVVSADPIVANFVLRRVNSVYYGLQRSIDDVRQAVLLLGFDEVCSLTMTVGMMQFREAAFTGEQTAIFKDIMKVSVGAAFYVRDLARRLSLPLKEKAFIVGLQHAVGRLVMLYNRPKEYAALRRETPRDFIPSASEERKQLGIDHAVIGAKALKWWNMPESITLVIGHYLRPGALKEKDLRSLALALSVAVAASEQLCQTTSARPGTPFFTPPVTIHALAKMKRKVSNDLVNMVRLQEEPAISYIKTMTQN